jgi:hypothetical protein
MKKKLTILITSLLVAIGMQAQLEPAAGKWKTWFITSGKDYRLPAPPSYKNEIAEVLSRQQALDSAGRQQIVYWNAGAPGYRWQDMIAKVSQTDTGKYGMLSAMLLNAACYDATIAAWDTKYAYNRPRPFMADKRIKSYVLKPDSPSYPCEYSVAAGVAVAIFKRYHPSLADSVNRMAQRMMESRIAAGVVFPSDTRAGFELGKRIAEIEIEVTKDFVPGMAWDRKMPDRPGIWKGQNPMFPQAGLSKTVVLKNASQFRPPAPPEFAKDMAELKNFKQTFRSQANALFWATANFWDETLNKRMFEYNIHLNPPRAARLYAITAITMYDGFVACWDAKFAYWGIRPTQYDTTYRSFIPTPPFPGYPSGHAAISGGMAELFSYFFPEDKAFFQRRAKDAAESRFQAGIHFRTDNEVGLELGRKVAGEIVEKVKKDFEIADR